MNIIKTESELRAVIGGEKTAIVCFHSTRSAYSRRTVKILSGVESKFAPAAFWLVDADVDAFMRLLWEFDVVALPTIVIFCRAFQARTLIGERSERSFVTILEKYLKH